MANNMEIEERPKRNQSERDESVNERNYGLKGTTKRKLKEVKRKLLLQCYTKQTQFQAILLV